MKQAPVARTRDPCMLNIDLPLGTPQGRITTVTYLNINRVGQTVKQLH